MIATSGEVILAVAAAGDPIVATDWMRPAELPELEDWATVAAGVWLAEVLDWEPAVEIAAEYQALLMRPAEWHMQAVCATPDPAREVDPYWFGLDDVAGPTLNPERTAIAREHCNVCPVRVDCGYHGIVDKEKFGIWGGTTGRQRTAFRRRLAAGELTLQQLFGQLYG